MGRCTHSHVGPFSRAGGVREVRVEGCTKASRARGPLRGHADPLPALHLLCLLSPSIARLRLEANERTCPQAQDKGPGAGGPDVLCAANKIQMIMVDFREGKTCDLGPLGFALSVQ